MSDSRWDMIERLEASDPLSLSWGNWVEAPARDGQDGPMQCYCADCTERILTRVEGRWEKTGQRFGGWSWVIAGEDVSRPLFCHYCGGPMLYTLSELGRKQELDEFESCTDEELAQMRAYTIEALLWNLEGELMPRVFALARRYLALKERP